MTSVPVYLEMAVKEAGFMRLLFASRGPRLDVRVAKETIRLPGLEKAAHEPVMGGNLLRVLKLSPD